LHSVPGYGLTVVRMDLTAPDTGPGWVPVEACTLPTHEQPLRLAEFDDLFATSLRGIEHPHGPPAARARLLLAGDEALAGRVQRLADAEAACCSFFTFTVAPVAGAAAGESVVALDIEVPATRADILAALVQRAERAGS
jgi:hypothetical protein